MKRLLKPFAHVRPTLDGNVTTTLNQRFNVHLVVTRPTSLQKSTTSNEEIAEAVHSC